MKILTVDFARFETEYVAVVEIRKVSWLFRKISSRLEKSVFLRGAPDRGAPLSACPEKIPHEKKQNRIKPEKNFAARIVLGKNM